MKRIALVRGKFLNRYEMQLFEPLSMRYRMTAFGSLTPFHDQFAFPVMKLPSPMDIREFPYKMQILNRLFVDAHYLLGLEGRLKDFDLVHTAETYFHYTRQCLEAKRRGYVHKVIATVYENIPFNNEGIWGRKGYKARARRELDHIIAISEKSKQALVAEGADPKKITVIGHYIDTKHFAPAHDYLKRLSDAKRKTLTVLFVGRLEVYKGVLDVLAAGQILSRLPDLSGFTINCVFVGNGSLRSYMIEKERTIAPNWHFRHESATYDEMPDIYRNADIFVAPSKPSPTWQEQYNIALLEAQSAGLPIVTTATGAIVENVGDAAIVVEPGDVKAISLALKQFMLHPGKRAQYAKRARDRALSVHDISIGSERIATLYDRVLSE